MKNKTAKNKAEKLVSDNKDYFDIIAARIAKRVMNGEEYHENMIEQEMKKHASWLEELREGKTEKAQDFLTTATAIIYKELQE